SEWVPCGVCGTYLYAKRFLRNLKVCYECGWHARLDAPQRIEQLFDLDSACQLGVDAVQVDPLEFTDTKPYAVRLAEAREAGVLTISLITDPTYGGVAASFATLTDVIIAEPGARMGFAGPRVIEQTIRQQLPEGFQTAEFLLAHGLVDDVCPRSALRTTIA